MKTKKPILILLPVIIDSCSAETSAQLATGTVKECLEGLTTKLFLAKSSFRFTNLAAFKDKTAWETAISAEDLVPLFNVYEVASDNTEATKYETGNFVYTTKKEVKKMKSESYVSICSHRALKSYENSDYTQVFEVTEKKEVLGVYDPDGVKIKGQDVSDFDVAIRERPTKDKPGFTMVTITYRDFEEFEDNGVIAQMTWDPNVLNGPFGLSLRILTASATEITFQALQSCGANFYNDLVAADMIALTTGGASQTITALSNANDTYLLEGTFASGLLSTDGVVTDGSVEVKSDIASFTV